MFFFSMFFFFFGGGFVKIKTPPVFFTKASSDELVLAVGGSWKSKPKNLGGLQ